MNYTKPLTPALRKQIDEGIEMQLMKLEGCHNTAYISAIIRIGLTTAKNLIYGLPNGFPILINSERRRRE